MWTPDFPPPGGCGHNHTTYPNGTIHHTLYSPYFRRSWNELPDGRFVEDHIGPNSGRMTGPHGRQPFNSPYDQVNPK